MTKKDSAQRTAVRFGRPRKGLAGEVDERILNAARKIFLERGFEGASMDEIADAARSGKPTIYARFSDKRTLFSAVVKRDILSRISPLKAEQPSGATVEERLVNAGIGMLHWTLDNDRIGLMQLAVAEGRRFPDLASTVSRTARELSTEMAAGFLGKLAQSGELSSLPAFTPERLPITASFFLDLIVVPTLLRALFEVKVEVLEAEIAPHVARSVAFFLAGCRHKPRRRARRG